MIVLTEKNKPIYKVLANNPSRDLPKEIVQKNVPKMFCLSSMRTISSQNTSFVAVLSRGPMLQKAI